MTDHQYIYLCYGKSPSVMRELRYSIETLLPEIGGDSSRITIFTDQPRAFDGGKERIVDIGPRLAQMTWGRTYMFRAKPLVLAEALRLHGRACVLLDTDSFIRRGFDAEVARALAAGAAMNQFRAQGSLSVLRPLRDDAAASRPLPLRCGKGADAQFRPRRGAARTSSAARGRASNCSTGSGPPDCFGTISSNSSSPRAFASGASRSN